MNTVRARSILFVTGAFVSHSCWDDWRTFFESEGYSTSAPPWPFKDGTAAELRSRQPHDTGLALLTLAEVVDSYARAAEAMQEKPIIIGHSLGGLVTQILINRGYAAAGVAIHPVPPLGVIPYEFSFLRGGWKSLGLFTSVKKTYLMSFRDWQYAFVNGMPADEQRATYDEFIIPESKTVARGGLTGAARVDFHKSHVPLLITSGSEDTIIPAHLNHRNYNAYRKNGSVIEYKEFECRNHFVLGQASWREDAEYILTFIETHLGKQTHA